MSVTDILLMILFCGIFCGLSGWYLKVRKPYIPEEQRDGSVPSDTISSDGKWFWIIPSMLFVVSCGLFCFGMLRVNLRFYEALRNAFMCVWIGTIGFIDAKEKIIPNEMILIGIGSWILLTIYEIFYIGYAWKSCLMFGLVGAGVCGGGMLLIALIVKSALGMGDVKMFTVLGLIYGLSITYSILLFTMIIMAIISIILLIAKKVTRKTAIPVGPFTIIGFLLCMLAGV